MDAFPRSSLPPNSFPRVSGDDRYLGPYGSKNASQSVCKDWLEHRADT